MKLSSFLSLIKAESLQNISDDFYDSKDFVNSISRSLDYIFRYLNAKSIFPYWAIEEEVTADSLDPRLFILSNKLQWLIWDRDDTEIDSFSDRWSESWVWGDGKSLSQKNFFITQDKWDFFTFVPSIEWIKSIRTSKAYGSLKIRYKRWPKYPQIDEVNEDIDLPEDLIWVLLNLCMWRVIPLFLENWFDLANNYYLQSNEDLDNYAQVMGGAVWTDRFTG